MPAEVPPDRQVDQAHRAPRGELPRLCQPAVVFTDLDGTLLDHHTYSPGPALEALRRLEDCGVPVVMTTSKTFEETLAHQSLLRNPTPFIVENGGVVCIPQEDEPPSTNGEVVGGYRLYVARPGLDDILTNVRLLRERLCAGFTTFQDVDAAWVSQQTGLGMERAKLARRRRASLPLLWEDSGSKLEQFREALLDKGLTLLQGGRFHHVLGDWDKSDGMDKVLDFYNPRYPAKPQVIAFGDSPNDRSMLAKADIAIVVRNIHDRHLALENHPNSLFTDAIGPQGWAEAVNLLLQSE